MKIITPQLRTRLHLLPWSGSPTTAPIYLEGTTAPQVVAHIRQSGALREVTEGKPPHTVLEVQDIDADGLRIDRKYMELAELSPEKIREELLGLIGTSTHLSDLYALAMRIVGDVPEQEVKTCRSQRSNEVLFLFYYMAVKHRDHKVAPTARFVGKHHTTVMHALHAVGKALEAGHALWLEYAERARQVLKTGVLPPATWTSTPVHGPVEVIHRRSGIIEVTEGTVKNSGYSLYGIEAPKSRLKWRPKN